MTLHYILTNALSHQVICFFEQSSHNFCMYFLNQRRADGVHICLVYCGSCQRLTCLLIFQCCSLLSWLHSSVADDHPFLFHYKLTFRGPIVSLLYSLPQLLGKRYRQFLVMFSSKRFRRDLSATFEYHPHIEWHADILNFFFIYGLCQISDCYL